MTMTSSADRRIVGPVTPATVVPGRYHGSLDAITDSERRALRPIGTSAHEVAVRTGALLTDLLALPGVRIFQGVRPAAAEDLPRIPHAISAGRQLILVESVAWPPGQYAAKAAGHRVGALVVVHPTTAGDLVLPASTTRDVAWTCASDAVRTIRARLPRGRQAVSMRAVATLFAATAGEECR